MEIMQQFGDMYSSLSGTKNTAIQLSGLAILSFFVSFYPVKAEASKLNILIAIADDASWKHFYHSDYS